MIVRTVTYWITCVCDSDSRVKSISCFIWNGEFLHVWLMHLLCEIKSTYLNASRRWLLTVLASLPEAIWRSSKLWLVNIVLGTSMKRTHDVITVVPKWGNLVPIEHKFSFTVWCANLWKNQKPFAPHGWCNDQEIACFLSLASILTEVDFLLETRIVRILQNVGFEPWDFTN